MTATTIASAWTPAQLAELAETLQQQVEIQVRGDAELQAMLDWMIRACGLEPSDAHYRLAFMVSVVMTHGGLGELLPEG